jgi:hypothetical protein
MAYGRKLVLAIALMGIGSASAQEALSVPDAPFKTIHLMKVTPAQEAALKTAVRDFNREFAEQGCKTCVYRLSKIVRTKDESFSFLMTADWPGGETYKKIHASAGFAKVTNRNPIIIDLGKTEFYSRYVDAN